MLGILLGSTQPFRATKRLGVAVTTSAQGNPVYGDIELTGGVAVDAGGGDPPSVPPPYFKNVTLLREGGLAVTGVNTLGEAFTWSLAPSTSDDGQRASLGLYYHSARSGYIYVHAFHVTGSHSFPYDPRDGFACGATYNQCARSVYDLEDGGLGFTSSYGACETSVWLMAPVASPEQSVLRVFYKHAHSVAPVQVEAFSVRPGEAIPSEVVIPPASAAIDLATPAAGEGPHARAAWTAPPGASLKLARSDALSVAEGWYMAPLEDTDLSTTLSVAMCYRDSGGNTYVVRRYALDVRAMPALYMRFVDVYRDAGFGVVGGGGEAWYFAAHVDPTEGVAVLGLYLSLPGSDPLLLHRYCVSRDALPGPVASPSSFTEGGVGTASDDGGTWFFAPASDSTASDSTASASTASDSTATLQLFYKRDESTAPRLVHAYDANLASMSPSVTVGVPDAAQDLVLIPNSGVVDAGGARNPPHLQPVWLAAAGSSLALTTHGTGAGSWALWPLVAGRTMVVTYTAPGGALYVVHAFEYL
jgi:hypothetical protein